MFFDKLNDMVGSDGRPNPFHATGSTGGTSVIFSHWEHETMSLFESSFRLTDRLLTIAEHPDNSLELDVAYIPLLSDVVKETRNFQFLGQKIRPKIGRDARVLHDLHGPAVQLLEAVGIYKAMRRNVPEDDHMLFSESIGAIHKILEKMMPRTWLEVQEVNVGDDKIAAVLSREHPKKMIHNLHRSVIPFLYVSLIFTRIMQNCL